MSSASPLIDPALEKIIRTAGRPTASAPKVKPPREMPGEDGVISGLRFMLGIVTNGVGHLLDLRERYGDVFRAQFFDKQIVCVWDADLLQSISQNEGRTWSTALGWDALSTNGLDPAGNIGFTLTVDFEDHRAARKVLQPAFTFRAIDGYLVCAGRIFDEVIEGWLQRGRVDFKTEGRALLGRVATDIFLGLRDPAKVAEVDGALHEFWSSYKALSRNPRISPTFKRARKGMQTLMRILRELVPERRREGGSDVFSHLCRGVEPDDAGDEALVRVFVGMMLAAYDTTANALVSMAYLLAKNPDWQQRLREELATVPQGALDGASLKNLRLTEQAWKETLRLMPIAGFLPRVVLRDVDLGGYPVRAGTFVAPMFGAIGRHPRWWKDPGRFDPERFSPERAEDRQHPAIYQPFGAGPHACIGMQLANLEVKLFWHKLLARCSFALEKDYEAKHTFPALGTVSGKVALRLSPLVS